MRIAALEREQALGQLMHSAKLCMSDVSSCVAVHYNGRHGNPGDTISDLV